MAWGQAYLQLLDRRLGKNPAWGCCGASWLTQRCAPKVPGEQEWLAFPSAVVSQRLVVRWAKYKDGQADLGIINLFLLNTSR